VRQTPFVTVSQHTEDMCILHQYEKTVIYVIYDTDLEVRLSFVNWYLQGIHGVEIEPTLCLPDKLRLDQSMHTLPE
jgi:hypothetical protein